jgi:hypothetical protein
MLPLFTFLSVSSTTADLSPPFQLNKKGNIGHWEFGGTALVEEQSILLVPAVQYHKGYIWTNVEIPRGDWGLELDFQIPEGNGGGGLGIWFTDTYMADGPRNGGPDRYAGLGILLNVVVGRTNSQGLFLSVRIQHRPDKNAPPFNINEPGPIAVLPLNPQRPFTVELHFLKENVTVSVAGEEIANEFVQAKIRDSYLGITAACESRVSRVELLGARFEIDEKRNASPKFRLEDLIGEHKPSGHVHQHSPSALRGAAFHLTTSEYERMKANGGKIETEADADRLFSIIDEVGAVNYEVASFSELSDFVNKKLLVHAQKWQARTLKIVERVQQSRNVAGAAWNYTQQVMEAFNSSLRTTVLKTTGKIGDLGEFLAEVAGKGIDEGDALARIADDVNKSNVIRLILYVAEIEFLAIVVFFVLVNIPSVRRRLLSTD